MSNEFVFLENGCIFYPTLRGMSTLQILKLDGDPLDACSIAALVALTCTKIPQTELSLGESGEPEDFELVGDLASANLLDVSKIPVIVTVNKVGSALVLDTAGCESACVSSSLSAAFDRDGNCCGLMKGRGGNISSIETIDAISVILFFSLKIYPFFSLLILNFK